MTLPNFLIVGAAKAGTTSIHAYLKQHPEVFLSTPKEPRFFALEGQTLDFQGPTPIINRTSVTTWEDYQALFAGAEGKTAVGEASTIYLSDPSSVNRIQHYLGQPKIIAILRNPVSRAYSSYLHLVRDGQETLSFEKALEQEDERISNNWPPLWHYRQRGFYHDQVKRYLEAFGPEQVKVLLFDDLRQNPQAMMSEIFKFLGIDSEFEPDVTQISNVSGVPQSRFLSRILNRDNPLKSSLKAILPRRFRKNVYRSLQVMNTGDKTQINPQIKAKLREDYRADIERLQSLINRDLSHWLTP